MQKQMVAPREHLQPLVKEEPSSWSMVIITGISSACFWLATLVTGLTGHGIAFYYAILASITMLSPCLQISRTLFAKRIERKRQAAAWGDQRLLAASQPTPTTQTLTLPFTMRMRPRWGLLIAFAAFASLMMGVCWSALFIFNSPTWTSLAEHAPVLFWSLVAGSVLVGPVLSFIMGYSAARQQVTLTEHGIIQVGIFDRPKSIPWSQVRLFAVRPIPVLFRKPSSQPPIAFEVASADETLQWSWALNKGVFHILFSGRPAGTAAEYEQQMRAMLAVIQERTHLPLYDLRKQF